MSSLLPLRSVALPSVPESQSQAVSHPCPSLDFEGDDERTVDGPEPRPAVLPQNMQRLSVARARIYEEARAGHRIRTYEIALDLDIAGGAEALAQAMSRR